ncbi:hypothetical protein ABVT39_004200 [Epinephelus coioides]
MNSSCNVCFRHTPVVLLALLHHNLTTTLLLIHSVLNNGRREREEKANECMDLSFQLMPFMPARAPPQSVDEGTKPVLLFSPLAITIATPTTQDSLRIEHAQT